jgi:transposase
MVRRQLDDRQWARVAAFLSSERGPGRPAKDDRNFIEAVFWWRRTGVPWRDLPDEFGPWQTVFNRFDRWSKQGRWSRLLVAMRTDVDDEWHSVDATINRAHQHAAGGKGGPQATPSVVHVAVHRRRCTSSSTRSDYQSTSK